MEAPGCSSRESQVRVQMNSTIEVIGTMANVITSLEERLSSVMTKQSSPTAQVDQEEVENLVPLAEELRAVFSTVIYLSERIQMIINRVEV